MNKGIYVAAGIATFLVARKFFTVEEPNYFDPEKEDAAPPRPYTPPPIVQPINYAPPTTNQYYGNHWGNRRPYGYPESGRSVNRMGDAVGLIRQVCSDQGYANAFTEGMLQLAQHESGTTIALPSIPFDVRPAAERPILSSGKRKPYVSAWGVFSFNNIAWRDLKRRLPWIPNYNVGPCSVIDIENSHPWESTPYEEVYFPLVRYSQIYNYAISNGFTPHDALVVTCASHGGGGMAAGLLSHGPNGWRAYGESYPDEGMRKWLFNECIPMADRAIAALS